ncbi:Hypothetical predicted protein [Mytilus galloprovincialis]|uniref:Peptidase A2 domain-containing protein n=1 Tax=Mytilus galloprovincialis TaxID=29158 RepID=A0A8B6GG68_MYTGA|nr:Hypothetical predicted protein [Mytilus galloprovincialis]
MVGKANETHVYVNGKKCKSLIDSGSMVSTISEPTLRSFHTVPTIKTLDEFILSVRVAEGSQLPYLGYVEVNIKAPFHTEPMMVPLLVVPETDYNRSVPIIIGTNVLRPMKSTLTSDSEVNIPHEWDTAFSAMDSSIVSLVKSTNKRPIKVSPMSSMTVTGLCKAKSSIQTAVTECVDDNQSSLGVCPRVVNLKSTGTNRIPVRIFNMSTKVIYVKPKSVLCGLNEVKIVRHAALDSSVEETGEKASDECDKGKILKNIGVELTEVTPETKRLCKAKSSIQTAVTECVDDNQSSLGVCPRVVNLKSTGTNRIPVRIFNMSTKVIYVKPKSVLCGLNEVKIVRHAALDSSVEETGEKASDECDKGKILKNIGVELTEVTPETKSISSGLPVKDHKTYVSNLEKRLQFAYKTAAKVADKAGKRHKTRYDLKVRHSNLQKGDRVLLKKVGFKGKHKLQNKWNRDPYIVESQPDTSIPVYVLKPEHGRSRKVTVHRNMLLPIFSLPTDEIVRQQIPSSCKKGKTFTRPQNLQKDDTVDSDKNELMLTEAPEFLPSSSSSSLPVSDLSSSRSDFSGDLLSDTSGQSSVHSGVNDSSTLSGMSASGHTENNSVAFEATDTQPVLRRTTRQCRAPQRYQDFILYR